MDVKRQQKIVRPEEPLPGGTPIEKAPEPDLGALKQETASRYIAQLELEEAWENLSGDPCDLPQIPSVP